MNVLIVSQIPKEQGGSFTTGITNVTHELCKCRRNDVKLTLFATNISDSKAKGIQAYNVRGFSKNPIVYVLYALAHPLLAIKSLVYYRKKMQVSPLRFFFYQVNLDRCVRDTKPDVVHAMSSTLFPTVKMVVGNRIPSIVTFHGFHYKKENDSPEPLTESIMEIADNITALTIEAKDNILKHFPKQYNFLTIIPNGGDTTKFYYSEKDRCELRSGLGIKDNEIIFITVGNINENKGQLRFIKYLEQSNINNYKYLIVGKGVWEEKVKEYVTEHNLQDKVIMLGYISNTEAYKYYSAADVYAQASFMEGQSLSEIEAELTGMRVVVNKTLKGTIPGDVGDFRKYYVIDFEDPSYESFKEWIGLGNNDRQSTDVYDWNKVFDRYVEVYREVIKGRL